MASLHAGAFSAFSPGGTPCGATSGAAPPGTCSASSGGGGAGGSTAKGKACVSRGGSGSGAREGGGSKAAGAGTAGVATASVKKRSSVRLRGGAGAGPALGTAAAAAAADAARLKEEEANEGSGEEDDDEICRELKAAWRQLIVHDSRALHQLAELEGIDGTCSSQVCRVPGGWLFGPTGDFCCAGTGPIFTKTSAANVNFFRLPINYCCTINYHDTQDPARHRGWSSLTRMSFCLAVYAFLPPPPDTPNTQGSVDKIGSCFRAFLIGRTKRRTSCAAPTSSAKCTRAAPIGRPRYARMGYNIMSQRVAARRRGQEVAKGFKIL